MHKHTHLQAIYGIVVEVCWYTNANVAICLAEILTKWIIGSDNVIRLLLLP